jgi:hypothetical protein
MENETCTRCSKVVKITVNKLCGGCLELLGYDAEAASVKKWEADYALGYAEGVALEHGRLMTILTLPEAEGRQPLAVKLAAMPSMTAEKALTILAAAPREQPTGPDAEFRAMMARLHPEPPVVEGNEEAEAVALVTRMQTYDEADQAKRAEERGARRRHEE